MHSTHLTRNAIVTTLALATVGWCQPPAAQPPKGDEKPGGHAAIGGDAIAITKNGKGKVLTETLRLPKQPAFAAVQRVLAGQGAGGGSLALNDKHVFVLLNGVLYQYDIETLELEAHVKVQAPGQKTVETATFPAGAWGAVFGEPRAKAAGKPRLGINIAPVTKELADERGLDEAAGVQVTGVAPDSVAERAGLKQGDLILRYNNAAVETPQDLMKAVQDTKAGAEVEIVVRRDGKEETLKAKVD